MPLDRPIGRTPEPDHEEWERVKAGLSVGQRLTGRVVWVPRVGTIGIGVDIGRAAPGFVDALALPPDGDAWPCLGETRDFRVVDFTDHNRQVRLVPVTDGPH